MIKYTCFKDGDLKKQKRHLFAATEQIKMGEQRRTRKHTKAEREERLRRKRMRKIKKYIRFFAAWGLLLAVIILIIVLIVSCASKARASHNQNDPVGQKTEAVTGEGGASAENGASAESGASEEAQNKDQTESESTTEETSPAPAAWDGVTAEEMIEKGLASKVVFLTFDDGPSENTSHLLDILKAHNVQATFFVVGWDESKFDMITREHAEGHTVAVHSLTHQYSLIYTADDVFWDDNAKMNDIIEERTGVRADLMRFPGGASNHVSADYNSGIMTRLTEQALERGYDYVDWNVSSGDGGATDSTAQIYENVTQGIEKNDISVVLMHDSHDYTVAAVDDIIKYCEDYGYTMLPLHKGIFTCHHGVWN